MKKELCRRCGIRPVEALGKGKYRTVCWKCHPASRRKLMRKKPWLLVFDEKPMCQLCGFIPLVQRQMDIHHMDGNKENNNIENLMIICSNCHRLITHLSEGKWEILSRKALN